MTPLPTPPDMHTRRPMIVALGVAAVLALVVGVVAYNLLGGSGDDDPDLSDAPTSAGTSAADDPEPGGRIGTGDTSAADLSDTTAADVGDAEPDRSAVADDDGDGFVPPAWSLIANLDGDVAAFTEPGGDRDGTVEATWHDRPSALRVFEERGDWLRVGLQQRPNGSTAWVRRSDVTLTSTPYWIRIDVDAMRLRLYHNSELVMDAPVGVGTADAPTPTGEFFVTFLQEPPDDGANWGPFVMVTNGHSETISDFQMSGDAITGIHGPLGAGASIADTGAKVSKGCVRMHLDDLAMLRAVPAGTPIDIVDSSTRAPRA